MNDKAPQQAVRAARPLLVCLLTLAVPRLAGAAESLASAESDGRALAAEMREQRPADNLATQGFLRRRDPEGNWGEPSAVRMEAEVSEDAWRTRYRAFTPSGRIIESLAIHHATGQPNRYLVWQGDAANDPNAPGAPLIGEAAAIPFAGSDFWLSDLGLEFFHWPQQRILKHEMRKGRSCKVLESLAPNPSQGGYARVLSWIDIEHRGLLRAEAYDSNRKLVKEFSIGNFKKVNGRWQLKSMEIRNERTDARTRLEFDLEFE